MNPTTAFANRTARLAREASTPVYTTETPAPKEREHMTVVEIEYLGGGRAWSAPMPDSEVDPYLDRVLSVNSISDIDHAAACWCFK